MELKHIALVCSSEERSDRFYRDILGLKRTGTKTVPSEISKHIFNMESEYKIINYSDDRTLFEIFIDPVKVSEDSGIGHICIKVDDVEDFLIKCREKEVEIIRLAKGDGNFLIFVRELDGNLFEIK